jgi:hypothetical protein
MGATVKQIIISLVVVVVALIIYDKWIKGRV